MRSLFAVRLALAFAALTFIAHAPLPAQSVTWSLSDAWDSRSVTLTFNDCVPASGFILPAILRDLEQAKKDLVVPNFREWARITIMLPAHGPALSIPSFEAITSKGVIRVEPFQIPPDVAPQIEGAFGLKLGGTLADAATAMSRPPYLMRDEPWNPYPGFQTTLSPIKQVRRLVVHGLVYSVAPNTRTDPFSSYYAVVSAQSGRIVSIIGAADTQASYGAVGPLRHALVRKYGQPFKDHAQGTIVSEKPAFRSYPDSLMVRERLIRTERHRGVFTIQYLDLALLNLAAEEDEAVRSAEYAKERTKREAQLERDAAAIDIDNL